MAEKISRKKRRCRKRSCRKTFWSVNGHPVCQACMTDLAIAFWTSMGHTPAEISKIITAR